MYFLRMHEDDDATLTKEGPFIGLVSRHERLPLVKRMSTKPKVEVTPKPKRVAIDPLDAAAQKVEGTDEFLRVPEPDDGRVAYEQQVLWLIVARLDDGAWTHQLVAENIKASSFASRRRAEGVMSWLRQQAEANQLPIEYRLIPLLRAEQAI